MFKKLLSIFFPAAKTPFRFHGGLHVPSHKHLSTQKPSQAAPIFSHYYLSLRQQDGQDFICHVQIGDKVLRGQLLASPSTNRDAPLHAPTSGIIMGIEEYPNMHPSNLPVPHLVLASDGQDEHIPSSPSLPYLETPPAQLLEQIAAAGIVGLGGAGFPTARKLQHQSKILVINAAECEPYITCDDLQIRECAAEIITGAQITAHILGAEKILFGIEDDKPEAISILEKAALAAKDPRITIKSIPTRYPSGNARQLFELLLGVRVPANKHANEYGLICHNSGTMKAIFDAIIKGMPLTERYTTITGEGIAQPQVLRVRIGTTAADLIAHCGGEKGDNRHIIGGPMMGYEIANLQTPLQKTGNCLLILPTVEKGEENPCIRCARCADACPMELLPQQLLWYSQSNEQKRLEQYRLFDCIECGICAAVCPSTIPLVQYYRHSKDQIRAERAKNAAADRARERHNARLARLEREAEERKAQMEARRAKLQRPPMETSSTTTSENDKQKALEEAKNRAAAKKTARLTANNQQSNDKQEEITAAKERAAARKAERLGKTTPPIHELPSDADKKAAIEAAKARAAARKAERLGKTSPPVHELPSDADKKAAIEAAKARAAAKKAERLGKTSPPVHELPSDADKKAAIEAAKARAAARKAERLGKTSPPVHELPSDADKKAAIEAAKARAAARKAERLGKTSPPVHELPSDADKKAATEAAKARAAARKAERLGKTPPPVHELPSDEDKKAATEAAKARAATRKAERLGKTPPLVHELPSDEDKKAAIEASKARAAARKAERLGKTPPPVHELPSDADKKAAIEAAKARAAARKAERLSQPNKDKNI